jgi:hypothetical protein
MLEDTMVVVGVVVVGGGEPCVLWKSISRMPRMTTTTHDIAPNAVKG